MIILTDAFKNKIANKIFSDEIITIIFHQDDPGPNGTANSFGVDAGILDMRPEDWELGDTGIIQQATDMNVGKLNSSPVTVRWFSIWDSSATYLGKKKLVRNFRLPGNDSLRLSARTIRIKFG